MSDSIFTKIMKGELPCHKVYEDEHAFAFMDIYPAVPGMVLVVSRRQVVEFTDLRAEELAGLMAAVQTIARKLKTVFPDKTRIGVQIEGLDVPHVHVKLLPVSSGDEFRARPDTSKEPDHATLAALAERIRV